MHSLFKMWWNIDTLNWYKTHCQIDFISVLFYRFPILHFERRASMDEVTASFFLINAHFFLVRLNTQAFHTFNYSVANINEAPNLFRYYSCPSFNSGCQPFGFPSSRSMLQATLHRLIFSSLTRGESAALCHSLNRPRVSLPPHWTGASVGGFTWARVILINIVRGSFMSFTCTSREILLWSIH